MWEGGEEDGGYGWWREIEDGRERIGDRGKTKIGGGVGDAQEGTAGESAGRDTVTEGEVEEDGIDL